MNPSSLQSRTDSSRCESTLSSSELGSGGTGTEKSSSEPDFTADRLDELQQEAIPPRQLSFVDFETSAASSKPSAPPFAATSEQLEIHLQPAGRRCYSCRKLLPIEQFARVRSKDTPGVEYRNPRCNKCRGVRNAGSPRVRRVRQAIEDLKKAPCSDCGRTFPTVCMDFDHVRGEKKFNIASAVNWRRLEDILEEVAKCDLVCSNCHRIRSAARIADGTAKHRCGRPPKLAEVPSNLSEMELPPRNQMLARTRLS